MIDETLPQRSAARRQEEDRPADPRAVAPRNPEMADSDTDQPGTRTAENPRGDLAIVLSGGGARAAYQVGLLRWLARRAPELHFDIVAGVSAGAINAAMLASHPGTLAESVAELIKLWERLESEQVFRVDSPSLSRHLARWGTRLVSGGSRFTAQPRGMVDTAPLRRLLRRQLAPLGPYGEILGIRKNLAEQRLRAFAVVTLNYATGQTVTWVQGRDIEGWERTNRRSLQARLTVEHVMASSALPMFFPAVRLGRDWHGDGGVRLVAPLSPALHLGAQRILAVSTRFVRTPSEEDRPKTVGYPPPAQILGHLMNAIFLDVLDQDVNRLERLNALLRELPPEKRQGMRPIDIVSVRPSVDLGALSADYEPRLPGVFRFMTRSLGTRETASPDFLSLLMFQPDYLQQLIEIGEADAEARADDLDRLLGTDAPPRAAEAETG
ncbi:MAG TPA: patatin-like phospholipase family protein [Thermoanaerobaculia bacterium]|nr:patatin-like phospholipase family protein [Thermoanaerobaculia bacterium]